MFIDMSTVIGSNVITPPLTKLEAVKVSLLASISTRPPFCEGPFTAKDELADKAKLM